MTAKRHQASAASVRARTLQLARPARAAASLRYFKTGPGEYGAGDRFLGLTVPQLRQLAREFGALPIATLRVLLRSGWHEQRLLALIIMVDQSADAGAQQQRVLRRLYLAELRYVNNWDLVDASAAVLLRPQPRYARAALLRRLARSPQLWRRRVAMIATFDDIRRGEFALTLELCRQLLDDPQDLMHKACGWMLRELGKRAPARLRGFLRRHAARMPRTMLRYAIERLPEAERRRIMRTSRPPPRGTRA
jgi:3-methyladenine DNA glycosylase AlkD